MSNPDFPPPAGAPSAGPPVVNVAIQDRNGLATGGFVVALIGLLLSWIPIVNFLGIILGVLGVILAAVGLAKAKRVRAGKGLGIAGVVVGVLAVIFAIAVNKDFSDSVDKVTDTAVQAPGKSGQSADTKFGTTRNNPAPLGSKITGDDWTVKVNSVKTADEDSVGQAPKAGYTLLVVNLTATYNGDDPQGDTWFGDLDFVTPSGSTIDGLTDGLFIPNDQFDSTKTLYHGASETGNEMFQVPVGNWQRGVLAVSPAALSDDTFVAVK